MIQEEIGEYPHSADIIPIKRADRSPEKPYKIVSNHLRARIYSRQQRSFLKKHPDQELIDILLEGHTVLLNDPIPLKGSGVSPYRRLYHHFQARGIRLNIHLIDDVDEGIFRQQLLWLEWFNVPYGCVRCGNVTVSSQSRRPKSAGCKDTTLDGSPSRNTTHQWRRITKVSFKNGVAHEVR